MSLNSSVGLGIVLSAKDLASGVVDNVSDKLSNLKRQGGSFGEATKRSFRDLSTGAAIASAGVATLGFSLGMAAQAHGFADAIRKTGARTNATAEEISQLTAAAQNVDLVKAGASFEDQAKILEGLALEGRDAKSAMLELAPAIHLGNVVGKSGAEVVGFLADTIDAFGKSSKDAGDVVDKMTFAIKGLGVDAGDLEQVLLPTASAANLVGASFEDTLLAVGLIKNTIPQAGKAAMAASMAMQQFADPKVRAELEGIGVKTKDLHGKFRPLVDILGDVAEKTGRMSAAQRSQQLASIFSARSAGGLSVIVDKLGQGVKDAAGNTLKGAAAVAHLRKEMEHSKGTAADLSNKLVSSDAQLAASLKSLATSIGLPFERALQPIKKRFAELVTQITAAFEKVPAPVKDAIAKFLLLGGAALTASGSFMSLKTGLGIVSKGLGVIGLDFAALGTSILPALGWMALFVAAGYTVYTAYQQNLGGLKDLIDGAVAKVSLGFKALTQLLTDGHLSGDVQKAFADPGNAGVFDFVGRIYDAIARVVAFFKGVGNGFSSTLQTIEPAFTSLVNVVERLFDRLSGGSKDIETNRRAFQGWADAGEQIGRVLGGAIEVAVSIISAALEVVDGFASKWDLVKDALSPISGAFSTVGDAIGRITTALRELTGSTDNTVSMWNLLGQAVGITASILASTISPVITLVANQLSDFAGMFSGVVGIIRGIMAGDWQQVWTGAKQIVFSTVMSIIDLVSTMASQVAGVIDSIGSTVGKNFGARAKVDAIKADIKGALASQLGVDQSQPETKPQIDSSTGLPSYMLNASSDQGVAPLARNMPLTATAEAAAKSGDASASAVTTAAQTAATAAAQAAAKSMAPVVARGDLIVDGEAIGRFLAKYAQSDAERSGVVASVVE